MVNYISKRFISIFLVTVMVSVVLAILPATPAEATVDIFDCDTADGYLTEHDLNDWSDCRDSTSADGKSDNSTQLEIITAENFDEYDISRTYLYFNTESIPDGATISSCDLKLYVTYIDDGDDGEIYVRRPYTGPPYTYPHDPLELGDYYRIRYSTTGYGYKDWGAMFEGGYNTITITTPNGIINKTGWTKILLLEGRDANNDDPDGLGDNELTFYSAESSYKPKLVITHVPANSPTISTDPATNVATTTARLNSTLVDDGGGDCDVRFGYGTTTQTAENFANYDTITDWASDYWSGEHPYRDVVSLVVDTPYYFRAQAKNDTGTTTGDEEEFTTLADLNPPTNFRGYPQATSISLSWAKGVGATQSLIRFAYGNYPDTTTDGTQVYLGTSASYTHTNLTRGTTIYYSVWGESGGEYSSSKVTTMVTTSAGADAGEAMEIPLMPMGWMQSPDPTAMENIEPLYTIFNNLADAYEIPRGTFWLTMALVLCMCIGIATYLVSHSLLAGGVVASMSMVVCVFIELIPSWMIFISIIFIFGIFQMRRRTA